MLAPATLRFISSACPWRQNPIPAFDFTSLPLALTLFLLKNQGTFFASILLIVVAYLLSLPFVARAQDYVHAPVPKWLDVIFFPVDWLMDHCPLYAALLLHIYRLLGGSM